MVNESRNKIRRVPGFRRLPNTFLFSRAFGLLKSVVMILVVCLLPVGAHSGQVPEEDYFYLDEAMLSYFKIKRGGPPRDSGIALMNPRFHSFEESKLPLDTKILGLKFKKVSKAYPIRFLNVHEIVNDRAGRQNFVVTYCSLCGTGASFATNLSNGVLQFNVSGLLYYRDSLMYDPLTWTLWSQVSGQGLAGRFDGKQLPRLQAKHTTLGAWLKDNPETLVMRGNPALEYLYAHGEMIHDGEKRRAYTLHSHRHGSKIHPKEFVFGITVGGQQKAYPVEMLKAFNAIQFTDRIGGQEVLVEWDQDFGAASFTAADGRVLFANYDYWWTWLAQYSKTEIFDAEKVVDKVVRPPKALDTEISEESLALVSE